MLSFIKNGDTVAFSGFSPAGAAKAVPRMLAEKLTRLTDNMDFSQAASC
ncbi:MAG: hypothetical protein ACNA7H_08195 [Desulfotignum sp.]